MNKKDFLLKALQKASAESDGGIRRGVRQGVLNAASRGGCFQLALLSWRLGAYVFPKEEEL